MKHTVCTHTCEIAEGGPTAQEVTFVISVGRLASGAFDPTALCFLYRGGVYEGNKVIDTETNILLRGGILNRTYYDGLHKNLPGIYLAIFTSNVRSYLLWSPVIHVCTTLRVGK